MLQLLEFQEKMDRQVPVIVGIATPTNYAETVVEVQNFLKWMVTEPEDKIRYYLDLCLKERLEALDFYAEFARVLAPRGRLFHYTGTPNRLSRGRDLPREVATRLRHVGFVTRLDGDGVVGEKRSTPACARRRPRRSTTKHAG